MESKFLYNDLPVRIVTDENEEIWFAGIDVCNILGYVDSYQAIKNLDKDDKKLYSLIDKSGRQRRKTCLINEFGVYSLIFKSKKTQAKIFKKWISHEILPRIRKDLKLQILL